MNNALRSAVRKHALANGQKSSKWTDEQIERYAADNNVTAADNLKAADALRVNRAAVSEEKVQKYVDSSNVTSIDDAVKALIAATTPKAAEIDEDRVIELIKAHGKTQVEHVVHVKREGEAAITRKMVHKSYADVLTAISAGDNLAAVGPAGSGKSTIFEQAAEDLGLDYYFQGAVQQEHKVLGYMDANGVYQRTQFRDAYEHGGLFVFEEFDGSGARALLAINNAVAGQWCDFPDGKIKRHENFVCVMAGNTYGTGASRQYVGRQQLDDATLDRFSFLEIDYDEDLELAMCEPLFEGAAAWVKRVQQFRRKVQQQGIRHVVSPRASIAGCKLLAAGMDEKKVIAMRLHKGLSADQLAALAS